MIESTLVSRGLEEQLSQMGFVSGAPDHIPPAIVQADVHIYRTMRCGACRHRGQSVRPMHRGSEYRLVCSCKKCVAQVEA